MPGGAQTLALTLLCLVSLFNYLDRYMLGILLPSIKADLKLTDNELGFISGTAFTIFYTLMGIPIGRLADRYSRRAVIAVALALWSAMTALFGLAHGFVTLALARVMVGVGEAGATPPAHSLISDLFPPHKRGLALSLFSMGLPAGILISFMVGGSIAQHLGWRPAMFAFGVPGLLLALMILFLLPEPVRGAADGIPVVATETPPLRTAMRTLFARRSFRHVCLGSGYFGLLFFGLVAWLPSYFIRSFGLAIGEVGTNLALTLGLSQFLGLAIGGVIADRLSQRDRRWYMWICAAGSLLPIPLYAAALLTARPDLAFIILFPAFMFSLLQGGPAVAIVQSVSGPRIRAVAVAVYLVIVNLIGGLGSQLIGLMSDKLTSSHGSESLGISILCAVTLFGILSSWHFWWGARTLREDMATALRD